MQDKTPEEIMARQLRLEGYPNTAKYIEMFGRDKLNPAFSKGLTKGSEEFYKKCVEEGHPWDWYYEFPEDATF